MSHEPTTVEAITADYLTPIAARMLGDPGAKVTTFELIYDPFEFPRFGEKQFYLIPFHYTSNGREGQSHLILRIMPRMDAVMMLTGDTEHRELKAFQQGLFNHVPETFHHPYVHVVLRPEIDQYWAFLEDLRPQMEALGMNEKAPDAVVRTILDHLAVFHARFWQKREIIDEPWLMSLRRPVDYFYRTVCDILDGMRDPAEPSLYVTERWPWLAEGVPNMMAGLPKSTREAVETIYREPEPLLQMVEKMPMTLCHYDFDNRNLGIEETADGPRTVVIDWEILGRGISASDVVRFMVYHNPENVAELQDHYLDALERELGQSVDREEWRLGYDLAAIAEWQIRGVLFGIMVNAPSAPVPDEMRPAMKERVFSDIGYVESLVRKHGLA
ncbi:MAG TPA: phosphotransferase [Dehalococcoidia bacterium]|nr:phosphotransferase [Dehalococcoidia bacterium]